MTSCSIGAELSGRASPSGGARSLVEGFEWLGLVDFRNELAAVGVVRWVGLGVQTGFLWYDVVVLKVMFDLG